MSILVIKPEKYGFLAEYRGFKAFFRLQTVIILKLFSYNRQDIMLFRIRIYTIKERKNL